MKTSKEVLLDKEYIKRRKDTFGGMNNVVKKSKKVLEFKSLNQIVEEYKLNFLNA